MTDREAAILAQLSEWTTLMHIGGANASFHSITARRMVPKGWVETRERENPKGLSRARVPLEYRTTAAGRQALANHRAVVAAAKSKVRADAV